MVARRSESASLLMKYQNINSNKKNRKNIYFVWNYLDWGGVQMYFLGLMRSVSEKYQVRVVLPQGSDKKILQYLDQNNIEYEFFDARIVNFDNRGWLNKIKRLVRRFGSQGDFV